MLLKEEINIYAAFNAFLCLCMVRHKLEGKYLS